MDPVSMTIFKAHTKDNCTTQQQTYMRELVLRQDLCSLFFLLGIFLPLNVPFPTFSLLGEVGLWWLLFDIGPQLEAVACR